MSLTISEGNRPISSATAVPWHVQERALKKMSPEQLQQLKSLEMTASEELTPENKAAQIAKQRAVKAHTVFSVNGKVIAMQKQSGSILFRSNADGMAARSGLDQANASGLTGQAANDLRADNVAAALRLKYGASLQVRTYSDPATAPTSGEIEDKMFGRTRQTGRMPAERSLVSSETAFLALLHQQRLAH